MNSSTAKKKSEFLLSHDLAGQRGVGGSNNPNHCGDVTAEEGNLV
jgi:hypothetical protein